MNKLIDAIKALWYSIFPKKTGYFYRLKTDGELAKVPLLEPEKPVSVEEIGEDFLVDNYEEDLAEIECPYNVASLSKLKKRDLEELAVDCGLILEKKEKKAALVRRLADYFGI